MSWYDMVKVNMTTHRTEVIEVEHKSEFELTKYIPYLAIMSEVWHVDCKEFGENWLP